MLPKGWDWIPTRYRKILYISDNGLIKREKHRIHASIMLVSFASGGWLAMDWPSTMVCSLLLLLHLGCGHSSSDQPQAPSSEIMEKTENSFSESPFTTISDAKKHSKKEDKKEEKEKKEKEKEKDKPLAAREYKSSVSDRLLSPDISPPKVGYPYKSGSQGAIRDARTGNGDD